MHSNRNLRISPKHTRTMMTLMMMMLVEMLFGCDDVLDATAADQLTDSRILTHTHGDIEARASSHRT